LDYGPEEGLFATSHHGKDPDGYTVEARADGFMRARFPETTTSTNPETLTVPPTFRATSLMPPVTTEQEIQILEQQLKILQPQLDAIRKRLNELRK